MAPKRKKGAAKKPAAKAGTIKAKPSAQKPAQTQPAVVSEWDAFDLTAASKWNLRNEIQEYKDELDIAAAGILEGKVRDIILSKGRKRSENKDKLRGEVDTRSLEEFSNFLKAKVITAVAENTNEPEFDEEWIAQRFLGCGAFGSVALWVKRDAEGVIVDQMAIKQAEPKNVDLWADGPALLAREAVLQSHLNGSNIENLVHLRSFKTIDTREPATTEATPKWKFYLEYAPHGELARLVDLYRAWNQYLPEAFLWHVFDSLAVALSAMAHHQPVLKKIPRQLHMPTRNSTVVHFDIKPENIFLGAETPRDKPEGSSYGGVAKFKRLEAMYPMVKLADFGVSEFVGKADNVNPGCYFGSIGTDWYKAPEIFSYGITWTEPPNGEPLDELVEGIKNGDPVLQDEHGRLIDWVQRHEERGKKSGIVINQATNVWNIGKVMFDLATLNRKWKYDDLSTKSFMQYKQFGENAIKDFTETPFSTSNRRGGATSPYSDRLMGLVQRCLRPKMADRIKPDDLIAATAEGLREQVIATFGEDKAEDKEVATSSGNGNENEGEGAPGLRGRSTSAQNATSTSVTDNGQVLPAWKVYYQGYSISDMQAGDEDFERIDPVDVKQPGTGFKDRAKKADIRNLLELDADPDDSWGSLKLPKYWEKALQKYNMDAKKKDLTVLKADFQGEVANDELLGPAPPSVAPGKPKSNTQKGTKKNKVNGGERGKPGDGKEEDSDEPPSKKTKKGHAKRNTKKPAAKPKTAAKRKKTATADADEGDGRDAPEPPRRSKRTKGNN